MLAKRQSVIAKSISPDMNLPVEFLLAILIYLIFLWAYIVAHVSENFLVINLLLAIAVLSYYVIFGNILYLCRNIMQNFSLIKVC